ncbi:hypothetical protein B0O80DRAFT_438878 [Mortierella sp. GBAus27b]|nr:hypothetical protein B0O80DRAFT_438878 [Mortierella sp. GBAus27b]
MCVCVRCVCVCVAVKTSYCYWVCDIVACGRSFVPLGFVGFVVGRLKILLFLLNWGVVVWCFVVFLGCMISSIMLAKL